MPLSQHRINQIREEHLQSLVDNGVAEDHYIDYKRDTYGGSPGDRLEFLKDISAFANADGGHIVLGAEEKGGIPKKLVGLVGVDVDREIARLENMLRDSIRPSLFGIDFRRVELSGRPPVIVVRIPRSWNTPHMVTATRHNRFWIRGATRKDMMSVEEIRSAVLASEEMSERARRFHQNRVEQIWEPLKGMERPRSARMVLHLIPYHSFRSGVYVNLSQIEDRWRNCGPIIGSTHDCRFNADGFLIRGHSGGSPQDFRCHVQWHRSGVVEAVEADFMYNDSGQKISGRDLDPKIIPGVTRLLEMMEAFGTQPPIGVFVSLLNCQGALIDMRPMMAGGIGAYIDRALVTIDEALIEKFGPNADKALKPALDALWNAAGWAQTPYFMTNGSRNSAIW